MWSVIGWIILVWAGCAVGWVVFFNLLGITFRPRGEALVDSVPLCGTSFQGSDAGSVSHPVRSDAPPPI